MSEPKKQHWVPEFLLKKWEIAAGEIPTWSLVGPKQKLFLKNYSAESICSELFLYNMKSEHEAKKHRIESDYLQQIDSCASKIVSKIERGDELDETDRTKFSKFIFNLHLRNHITIG